MGMDARSVRQRDRAQPVWRRELIGAHSEMIRLAKAVGGRCDMNDRPAPISMWTAMKIVKRVVVAILGEVVLAAAITLMALVVLVLLVFPGGVEVLANEWERANRWIRSTAIFSRRESTADKTKLMILIRFFCAYHHPGLRTGLRAGAVAVSGAGPAFLAGGT